MVDFPRSRSGIVEDVSDPLVMLVQRPDNPAQLGSAVAPLGLDRLEHVVDRDHDCVPTSLIVERLREGLGSLVRPGHAPAPVRHENRERAVAPLSRKPAGEVISAGLLGYSAILRWCDIERAGTHVRGRAS
jgi:hypothetical protein